MGLDTARFKEDIRSGILSERTKRDESRGGVFFKGKLKGHPAGHQIKEVSILLSFYLFFIFPILASSAGLIPPWEKKMSRRVLRFNHNK